MKLKYQVLSIIIVLSSFTALVCTAFLLYGHSDTVRNSELNNLLRREQQFEAQMASYGKELENLASLLVANEQLAEAIANGDKITSQKILTPIYKQLSQTLGVGAMEISKEGVIFLRVHDPARFGDDKRNNLQVAKALKGEKVAGFESGTLGLAIRSTIPIFYKDTVIGTLQTAIYVKDKLSGMKDVSGLNFYLIDDSLKERKIDGTGDNIAELKKNADKSTEKNINTGDFTYVFIPLKDLEGKFLGNLVVEYDWKPFYASRNSMAFKSALICMGLIALSFPVGIFFSKKITGRLYKLMKAIDNVSKGDFTVKV